jgi:phospho-N-acetylmuramoyl-pentapeptide-transferase
LQNQQVGETVRELGLAGQNEKRVRQPWSLIIIFATLVPVVLFAKLQNIYAFDRDHFVDGDNIL